MTDRKYNLSLGELIDRLAIVSLKHAKIPEHKEEYGKEIDDLLHDINLCLNGKREYINAEYLYDIIINAQFNAHIFHNEGDIRDDINGKDLTDEEYINIAKRLILTHSINGIRNMSKNRVSKVVGGRLDYKIDSLAADAEKWRPHGY